MITALVIVLLFAAGSIGAILGYKIGVERSRAAIDRKLYYAALDLARDLSVTPDVLDQHALTMSPGAQSVHTRANEIVQRFNNRKES